MDNQSNQNPETESFLNSLSQSLKSVSENRRNQELKEMRLHIEELAESMQAKGVSQLDSVHAAIEQMGDPVAIGAKLTDEWKQTSDGRKRILIRTILSLSVIGAVTYSVIWDINRLLFSYIYSPGGHPSNISIFKTVCMELIQTVAMAISMCVILVIGKSLARAMPRDAAPQTVIPPALYTGVLFNVILSELSPRPTMLTGIMSIKAILANITPQFFSGNFGTDWQAVGLLMLYSLNAFTRIVMLMILSAYFFMVIMKNGWSGFDKSNWKLRID